MSKSLEEYLKQLHAKDYQGTDDDMPDAFEHWLSQFDANDILKMAEDALAQYKREMKRKIRSIKYDDNPEAFTAQHNYLKKVLAEL